ncbi:DUF3987 domain-containing protein [Paraburkholderia denitrificans]|uniref:DUF3987 domain-containing protein n=1 Tax=Paraburkholderia denitrificans TaxID=694025 RepID=A0ABW0JEM1_9BURK
MYPSSYSHDFYLPDVNRFPSDALETKMRSLHDSQHAVIGIPSVVAGPIVLHAGIAYANPVANMISPNGHIGVFGINTMVSGNSGCGKSEAKKAAFAPMFQFQRAQLEKPESDDRIETHVMNNATMPAIIKCAAKYSILNEIDDEFSSAQTGSMVRYANIRNQFFDGHTFSVERATAGRYILHEPRFMSLVLTQPHVRIAFDKKHGPHLRTVGLATRTQFAEYAGDPVGLNLVPIDTSKWDDQANHLLYVWGEIVHGRMSRATVRFSPKATFALQAIREEYRVRGLPGGDLHSLPEHAARQSENIQRIATGMHVFEQLPGDVSDETVERAAAIGRWFTAQYKQRFLPKPEIPQVPREHTEAAHLEQVMFEAARRSGECMVKLKDLLSYAPNYGMTKAAVQRALIVLCSNDRTRIIKSQGKPDWIALNPMYFPIYRWPGH